MGCATDKQYDSVRAKVSTNIFEVDRCCGSVSYGKPSGPSRLKFDNSLLLAFMAEPLPILESVFPPHFDLRQAELDTEAYQRTRSNTTRLETWETAHSVKL